MVRKVLKKGFLLGIGTAFLTKEAATKKGKAFVREAKKHGVDFNAKEARLFVRNVINETKKQHAKLERESKREAKKIIKNLGYVSAKEAKILKKKVLKLEKTIMALTKKKATAAKNKVKRKVAPKRKKAAKRKTKKKASRKKRKR